MHLSPMWTPIIALQNLLNMLEIGLVFHPPVHMHSDIGRLALIGRTEPDVIGMDKTTPQGKMNLKAIPMNASLYLTQRCLHLLYWNRVLHRLQGYHPWRYIQAMAIVYLMNRSDSHC